MSNPNIPMFQFDLEKQEIELPSGSTAVVREWTGEDEEVLSNQMYIRDNVTIQKFVRRTTESYENKPVTDEIVMNMLFSEVESILIHGRILTHGPELATKCTCSHCKKEFKVNADLAELEFKEAPEEKFPTITLPKTKLIVQLKPIRYRDIYNITKASQSTNSSDLQTMQILSTIRNIEGYENNTYKSMLFKMPASDRSLLRDAVEKLQFGYETTNQYECPYCGGHTDLHLLSVRDFFIPALEKD